LISRKPALSKISTLIIVNLYFVSQNNETVQQFISKSKYNSSRQKYLQEQKELKMQRRESLSNPTPSLAKKDFGYLPSLLDYLLGVRAADSIALVAAGIIFNNRTLSRVVVTKDLIHFITGTLRKYSPSQKLIGLFTAMIAGSRKHIAKNQNLILEVVCSTTTNPVFIDNRRSVMIETQLHGKDIYVSWSGSSQYMRGRAIDAELFYDPVTLGLKGRHLAAPAELQEYLSRRKASSRRDSGGQWTKLVGLAWYIDPQNCYYFWKCNPAVAWRKHLEVMMGAEEGVSKQFRENLEHLRALCQHYLGVIELYTTMCSNR
jgi:hypothetical protein